MQDDIGVLPETPQLEDSGPDAASALAGGDFRILPVDAWRQLHAGFQLDRGEGAVVASASTSVEADSRILLTSSTQLDSSGGPDAAAASADDDIRILPTSSVQPDSSQGPDAALGAVEAVQDDIGVLPVTPQLEDSGPDAASASAAGDFRILPVDAWRQLHALFQLGSSEGVVVASASTSAEGDSRILLTSSTQLDSSGGPDAAAASADDDIRILLTSSIQPDRSQGPDAALGAVEAVQDDIGVLPETPQQGSSAGLEQGSPGSAEDSGPDAASASAGGDFRILLADAWRQLHALFQLGSSEGVVVASASTSVEGDSRILSTSSTQLDSSGGPDAAAASADDDIRILLTSSIQRSQGPDAALGAVEAVQDDIEVLPETPQLGSSAGLEQGSPGSAEDSGPDAASASAGSNFSILPANSRLSAQFARGRVPPERKYEPSASDSSGWWPALRAAFQETVCCGRMR